MATSVDEQVDLAGVVLGVAGVELDNRLDLAERGHVDEEGLRDQVPGDLLVAGRRGEGARVLVQLGAGHVLGDLGEVEGAGGGGVAGGGNLADAAQHGGDQGGGGVARAGNLKRDAHDRNGVVYKKHTSQYKQLSL